MTSIEHSENTTTVGNEDSSTATNLLSARVSRGSFLKLLGLGGTALGSTIFADRTGLSDDIWANIAGQELGYPWEEREPETIYSRDQLFVTSNPRIEAGLGGNGVAYVLVHAGYSEYVIQNLLKFARREGIRFADSGFKDDAYDMRGMLTGIYGDYHKYIGNVARLNQHLQSAGELTIFGSEERSFYNSTIPRESLKPFSEAMIVVTKNSTSIFASQVRTEIGTEEQDIELMLSELKKAGVKEVRMAGEWASSRSGMACLGGVAYAFLERGFYVRGISGCVYPEIPTGLKSSVVTKSLYADAVSV